MKLCAKFSILLQREAAKRSAHEAAIAPKPAKAKPVTKKARTKK